MYSIRKHVSMNVRKIVLKQTPSSDMVINFSIWVNLICRCGVNIVEEALLIYMFAMCNNDTMDYRTIDDE